MKRGVALALLGLVFSAGIAHAQIFPDISSYFDNAAGIRTERTAAPGAIDLLFESDSYVPPFYRGRAIPSPGSILHFQAIPRFNGPSSPDGQITYTWRRDGVVMGSVSGPGRSIVALPAPTLFGTDTISVEAQAVDGSFYGTASATISSTDPGVTLYQDHPLFGVEYYDALTAQTSIPDLEMTFAAVPYFIAAPGPNDPRLDYAWSVNGLAVAATSSARSKITINADNSTGLADVALMLTSPSNVLLSAQHSWNLLFSRTPLQGTPRP